MKALDTILTHVSETLPDSISHRREILTAMEILLTDEHKATPSIRAQLAAITAAETLQSELPLLFQGGGQP